MVRVDRDEERAGAFRPVADRAREEEPRREAACVAVRRELAEAPCRVDFLEAIANEGPVRRPAIQCAAVPVHLGG